MNVYPIGKYNKSYYNEYSQSPKIFGSKNKSAVSFQGKNISNWKFKEALRYVKFWQDEGFFDKGYTVQDLNFSRLDGIQKGISVFEDMFIAHPMFILQNLRGIWIKRGCSNQCGHCAFDAKPPILGKPEFINTMPWEDYAGIMDGIKKLSDRIGISVLESDFHNHDNEIRLFLDADCMEIALRDKKGIIHEYPEIITKLYDTTGRMALFDTGSWNYKSKEMQERAERYVKSFLNPEISEKIIQINLSISPYHSMYMKALELGYDPVSDTCSGLNSQKGRKLYQEYINRMANMLVTFSPLINNEKFGIIVRPLNDNVPNMEGFRKKDFKKVANDILKRVKEMLDEDLSNDKKYVSTEDEISNILKRYKADLNHTVSIIYLKGRMEKLFRSKNPNIAEKEIQKYFPEYKFMEDGFYMDTNGEVYYCCDNKFRPKGNDYVNISTKGKKTRGLPEYLLG